MTKGTIRFRGLDVLQASERTLRTIRGAQIGMIFQQPGLALNPVMPVHRQVAEVIHAHRPWRWPRCMEEAKLVLERVGGECGWLCQAYTHQLSGGQRQRVSIAQALACGPQLIIADKPTTSLDAVVQASILQIFQSLRCAPAVSLMLITHNPAILPGLADRVLVLRGGELVEDGTLRDFYRNPPEPDTAELARCTLARATQ
jgi:ABC-type microcin C transport system duplicated ATPase subunit YejF